MTAGLIDIPIDAFGYTTGITGAADGWMVQRNDTGSGGIRGPSDTRWTQIHRYADNIPLSEYIHPQQSDADHVYDVDICYGDSTRIVMAAYGRLLTSSDRGVSFQKVAAYKGGAYDSGLQWSPSFQGGGNYVRIDPVNKDVWAVGHPVDGCYITTDNGATIAVPASLPAPINGGGGTERKGVHIAFDRFSTNGTRCNDVYVLITGRGVYKSTTGLGGTFSLMAGSPTVCASIFAANGRVFVCGDSGSDTSLKMFNGTAWSEPSGIAGFSVIGKPDASGEIIVVTRGGDMHSSTDAGNSWATHANIAFASDGAEVPVSGVANVAYMAAGMVWWEVRSGINRLWLANGIGTFCFDNPPRTAALPKWQDKSRGIKQMLLKNGSVAGNRILLAAEDRPYWVIDRHKLNDPVPDHFPSYDTIIQHGGGHWCRTGGPGLHRWGQHHQQPHAYQRAGR